MIKFNLSKSVIATTIAIFFNASVVADVINIDTCESLELLSENPSGTFQLTSDIDCNGHELPSLGIFKGTLDGQGFNINQLTIIGTDSNVGLFEQLRGSEISNVTFDSAELSIAEDVQTIGILAGRAYDSQLTNVHVNNSVIDAPFAASLGAAMVLGTTDDTIGTNISVSNSNLNVTSTGATGQLFGRIKHSTFSTLSSRGNVISIDSESQNFVGGLVGNVFYSSLSSLHSSDNTISGQMLTRGKIGLLVGQLTYDSSIKTADLLNDYFDLPLDGDNLDKGIAAGFIYNPIDDAASLSDITATGVNPTLAWYNKRQSETDILTENLTIK